MKKILSFLFLILSTFIGFSQTNIPEPNPNTWVVDQAKVLNDPGKISHNLKGWEEQHKTGAEIVVVTVQSLEDYDKVEYAFTIGKKWGVGKKGANNGIVILIAPNDGRNGQWAIATGYGAEGILPDGKLKTMGENILKQSNIRQQAKKGNFDPFILEVIDAIHNEILNKESLNQPTVTQEVENPQIAEWTQAQKAAHDKEMSAMWDGIATFFGWLLFFGVLGLFGYLGYRMYLKRKKLIAEHDYIKGVILETIKSINDNGDINTNLKYKSIADLLETAASIGTRLKRSFFTWDIKSDVDMLTSNATALKRMYIKVIDNLESRTLIDERVKEISKSVIMNFSQYPIVQSFIDRVNEIDQMELDEDLKTAYSQICKMEERLKDLIKMQKILNDSVQSVKESDLLTTYYNHPNVQTFVNNIDSYIDLPIDTAIEGRYNEFSSQYRDIRVDVDLRRKYEKKEISFSHIDHVVKNAQDPIDSANIPFKIDVTELAEAKVLYKRFLEIQKESPSYIDTHWNEMKNAVLKIEQIFSKINDRANEGYDVYKKYTNTIREIPTITTSILSTYNTCGHELHKSGVRTTTIEQYKNFGKKWQNKNTTTAKLSYTDLMQLYNELVSLNTEIKSIHDSAVSQHKKHVREEEEEEKRERDRRDSYSSSSYSSFGSSSDYSSSSSSSSSDSFGGGDFGGGGSGGDF